jgi:lipid II:glycine glycyltransferase (peptidoglycan interpeptide bridge formation enzyme)
MGWTSIDGRDLNAQNLAMWRGMQKLKEDGFGFLDLGGIDTRREPGIARFKIGTGARLHRLAGTWM